MNGCAVLLRNKQVAIKEIKNVMKSLPIVQKQHTSFKKALLLILFFFYSLLPFSLLKLA